jgi:hypothetical protein
MMILIWLMLELPLLKYSVEDGNAAGEYDGWSSGEAAYKKYSGKAFSLRRVSS